MPLALSQKLSLTLPALTILAFQIQVAEQVPMVAPKPVEVAEYNPEILD
jgi:hypothetical protein